MLAGYAHVSAGCVDIAETLESSTCHDSDKSLQVNPNTYA